jgi:hypothetical protein
MSARVKSIAAEGIRVGAGQDLCKRLTEIVQQQCSVLTDYSPLDPLQCTEGKRNICPSNIRWHRLGGTALSSSAVLVEAMVVSLERENFELF